MLQSYEHNMLIVYILNSIINNNNIKLHFSNFELFDESL